MDEFWKSERCTSCGGTIVETHVDLHRKIRGEHVLIEGIPAGICTSCGARFYTPNVLKPLEAIIRRQQHAPKSVRVPVYSLFPFPELVLEEQETEEVISTN